MSKKKFSLSGMSDFSSLEVNRREYVFSVMKNIFEKYGFSPLETPAIEKRETLIEATQTLDRLLRAGNWMLPLFHDPKYRIAFQKDIRIPATIPLYGFNPWIAWRHK